MEDVVLAGQKIRTFFFFFYRRVCCQTGEFFLIIIFAFHPRAAAAGSACCLRWRSQGSTWYLVRASCTWTASCTTCASCTQMPRYRILCTHWSNRHDLNVKLSEQAHADCFRHFHRCTDCVYFTRVSAC